MAYLRRLTTSWARPPISWAHLARWMGSNGIRNNEIAKALAISDKTVERHLEDIYDKLDVTSRAVRR